MRSMESSTAEPDLIKNSEGDLLYLECATDQDHHHLTVSSLIAVFLQQYCHYYDVEIILVSKLGGYSKQELKTCPGDSNSDACSAPFKCNIGNSVASGDTSCTTLNGLELPKCLHQCRILKCESLPRVVQDCQLPCILLPGQQMCISGLANVLRWIVEVSAPKEPHRNLEALLGFRQTCLKGCSESSVWTKLCELEAPLQVSQFLSGALSAAASSASAAATSSSCLPFLSKFQELLAQPVSTFNSEKLRRKLLKKESKNKQERTGGGERNRSDGINGMKNKQQELANGSTEKEDVRTNADHDSDIRKANDGDENSASFPEQLGEIKRKNIVANLTKEENTSKMMEGETEENSIKLEGSEALDGGVTELRTEFNTKVFLCNKKAMRQQKRTSRQSANQANSTDTLNDRKSSKGPTSTEICTDKLNDIVSSKETNQNIDQGANQRAKSRRSNRKPRNKTVVHKDSLPELSHTFALGINVSLVDFGLLLPAHLYLQASQVNGRVQEACRTIPLVLQWYKCMWDVPCVRQVVSMCLEMREVENMSGTEDVCSKHAIIEEESKTSNYLSSSDIQPGIGNLRVSRPVVRELLKKVLPSVIASLEAQHLSVTFSSHPSKNTALDWTNMAPAVHPIEGELEAHRARNKEHQIESIVAAVRDIAKPGHRILDFCSGGGHLGIALAYCLPECHVIMIENKEESLRRALGRVQTLHLKNVTLYLSNIDYFNGSFDIGVSLHACGVATDIVLSKCMDQGASFVSSPCCYGSLHDTHHMTYPRSHVFREKNLSQRDYFLLGHAAEQTSWNFESPLALQGKQCMGYVDMDRAELAREQGYRVTLCSLQPETCSPKNNLLIGISPNIQGNQCTS